MEEPEEGNVQQEKKELLFMEALQAGITDQGCGQGKRGRKIGFPAPVVPSGDQTDMARPDGACFYFQKEEKAPCQ